MLVLKHRFYAGKAYIYFHENEKGDNDVANYIMTKPRPKMLV